MNVVPRLVAAGFIEREAGNYPVAFREKLA